MATEAERLAALEAKYSAHEKSDDERYSRIEANSTQTLNLITELGRKLDGGFTRAHERIDNENAARVEAMKGADSRISGLKVWFLSGAAALLLAAVIFFVAPYFSRPPANMGGAAAQSGAG